MMYEVIITEVLQRRVLVESDCPIHAEKSVRKKYANEDIVLDADDFQGVSFKTKEHGDKDRKA